MFNGKGKGEHPSKTGRRTSMGQGGGRDQQNFSNVDGAKRERARVWGKDNVRWDLVLNHKIVMTKW